MKVVKILFVLCVILFSIKFFSSNKIDPDLWGHLKFGQYIFENLEVPLYDLYSYSSFGKPWINHEWLSELIFYSIFRAVKGMGLVIFKIAIGLAITSLIYASVVRKTKSIFLRLLLIVPLSVMVYGFAFRPQLFIYLLFTLTVFCIDKFERSEKPVWLYPFPIIFLLWCNLHGGFVAGIGLLLFYVAVKIFTGKAKKELTLIAAACLIATLINPYGVTLWKFLLRTIPMRRPYISEWGTLKISLDYLNYFILLLFTVIGIIFSRSKRSFYEIALLAIGFFFSFRHNRHIVLFAILAAIYIPEYIDSFAGSRLALLERKLSRWFFILLFLCISLFSLYAAIYRGKTNPLQVEIPENEYPVDAVEFIRDNQIAGNIFCWFDWAQMCIRGLPGTNKVFFDGRYETVYSEDFIGNYFKIVLGEKDYKTYLEGFPQTDIMFMSKLMPLVDALLKDEDWITIYTSPIAIILVKNNNRNKKTIENFKNKRFIYPQEKQKINGVALE